MPHELALAVPPLGCTDTGVVLVWEKPPRAAEVGGYEVLLDGRLAGRSATMSHRLAGLAPSREYEVRVRARSAAGDVLADSAALRVATVAPPEVLDVVAFGAAGDGRTLATRAIQAAIDACPPGGKVLVPAGVFLSGALFLKSDMTFAVDGTLLGSDDPADYPFTSRRFPYYETASFAGLLNAYTTDYGSIRNVRICGRGTISGGGPSSEDPIHTALGVAQARLAGDLARADLLTLKGVENLYLGGVTLVQPAMHTAFVSYCRNVAVDGIDVRTYDLHNADGLNLAVCEDALVFGATFDTGDDCINLNAGLGKAGVDEGRSCRRIRIFDCRALRGHGGVVFGSHTAGWIRDVLVEDCVFDGTDRGIRFKTSRGMGGGAERILVRDVTMKDIRREAILFDGDYGRKEGRAVARFAPAEEGGHFRDVRIERVRCEGAGKAGIRIVGRPDRPNARLGFADLDLARTRGAVVEWLCDSEFVNVRLRDCVGAGSPWKIASAEGLRFEGCEPAPEGREEEEGA
jgi:exo-poly-alpha-galacturonosidase